MDLILHPRPLAGTVAAIPSKSWAHRLLLGAALSGEPTLLSCGPLSRDIQATMSCLSALGAELTYAGIYTFAAELDFPVEELEQLARIDGALVFRIPTLVAEAAPEGDFADALGQTRRMPVVKPAPKPPETGGHRRRRQAGFTVITDDSTKQVQ